MTLLAVSSTVLIDWLLRCMQPLCVVFVLKRRLLLYVMVDVSFLVLGGNNGAVGDDTGGGGEAVAEPGTVDTGTVDTSSVDAGTVADEAGGGGSDGASVADTVGGDGASVADTVGGDGWGSDGGVADGWGSGDLGVGLDTGVGDGAGLVEGLLNSGVGGDGSDDGLLPVDGLLGQDWAGDVVGGGDCAWLDGLDGGWGVDVGGLADGDGAGSDLGGDAGKGVSLSDTVGEVAAQPLVLNGGGVVGRGADQDGGWHSGGGDDGSGHDASGGGGSGGQDSDESLHFVCAEKRCLST